MITDIPTLKLFIFDQMLGLFFYTLHGNIPFITPNSLYSKCSECPSRAQPHSSRPAAANAAIKYLIMLVVNFEISEGIRGKPTSGQTFSLCISSPPAVLHSSSSNSGYYLSYRPKSISSFSSSSIARGLGTTNISLPSIFFAKALYSSA